MSVAKIWNKTSTNYGKNPFVWEHGTDSCKVESETQAMNLLAEAVHNTNIIRLELTFQSGIIIWIRDDESANTILETFKQDTEDDGFDMNDPRR